MPDPTFTPSAGEPPLAAAVDFLTLLLEALPDEALRPVPEIEQGPLGRDRARHFRCPRRPRRNGEVMTVDEVMRWVAEAIAQAESAVFAGMGSDSEELQERQRAEHKLDIARRAVEAYAAEKVRERTEECAKVCEEQGAEWDSDAVVTLKNYAAYCAAVIRARFLADEKEPDHD